MRESRNPFRLRAAEQIESDGTFARLFEPGLLDVLPEDSLRVPLTVLRSAPGAGKTSLLRLFTPSVLEHVRQNSPREEYRELAARLRALGAFAEDKLQVLGVSISCAQTFANLDELDGRGSTPSLRLFIGLLNARIVLAVLRTAASYLQVPLSDWLVTISVVPSGSLNVTGLMFPCRGDELYRWAMALEDRVSAALDHFGPADADSELGLPDSLVALSIFAPGTLVGEGPTLPTSVLVLLDDVQWLTERQRQELRTAVTRLRAPTLVWMAERYESLATSEILEGTRDGRDIVIVRLEKFWRERGARKLESYLRNLANRRAQVATDAEIHSFDTNLRDVLDGAHWAELLANALVTVRTRVEQVGINDARFADWIAVQGAAKETVYDSVLGWRRLEILMERIRRRSQLDFGLALAPSARRESDGSDVGAAAALYLAREFKLPYYFGPPALVSLSSSNVEQYLALAGDFFEEIVSAALLGRTTQLIAERQDRLVRHAAEARWRAIPSRASHGRAVQRFLNSAATFAAGVTYRATAPYAPGVTGFAYLMRDQERLYQKYPALAEVLASAVADNLLEPMPDYSCKGKSWMLFYFNRLVCVRFDLPLGYGGFREQRLETLNDWLTGSANTIQRQLSQVLDGSE